MTERLLQYIWRFQYFDSKTLFSTGKEKVQIVFPGIYNTNQGPDFLNAKIKIGETIWAGSIELHIYSSEWQRHKHSSDKNYANVILHVVWKDDLQQDLPFPTIELENRISGILLNRYSELMDARQFIPCQNHISLIPPLTIVSIKERLLAERLEERTKQIGVFLDQNNWNWEETFWWIIARNFGTKINSDAFETLGRTVPVRILAKNKSQIHRIEAILFGQAGLLNQLFKDAYPRMLQKEYLFLQKKYKLQAIHNQFFFLRMRPANFPTVRLAQLAALVIKSQHLFSTVRDAGSINEVQLLLNVTANDYWHYHYTFDEQTTYKQKILGRQMINNLLINTIIPIIFAYGHFNKNETLKSRALEWIELADAEKNSITRGFEALGIENKSSFDSQALLQLKNEYCDHKRCLNCSIGNKILQM